MVARAVGRPEVVRGARAWVVMHRWAEIVGPGLAERSTPDRYDRGVVWVAVRGSEWAQELRLMKDGLLERMNGAAGEKLFIDIRFGVRKQKPRPEMLSIKPVEPPRPPETDWREGLSILEIARRRIPGPLPGTGDGETDDRAE